MRYEALKVFGIIFGPMVVIALFAWAWIRLSGESANQGYEQAMFDCEALGGVYERHWGKSQTEPSHNHKACMIGGRHLWTDSSAGRLWARGIAIPPHL